MKHLDELSQILGTKVQKACRNTDATLAAVVADDEVLQAIQNLIYHYKIMTNGESISTKDTVSERKESELPGATERDRPEEIQTITN